MKTNYKNFGFKQNKIIPIDKFIEKALYDENFGYYFKNIPFGEKGDFITSPTISNLFSEMIAIWIVSAWEKFGKPEKFNFVELGPGDGSLSKVLVRTFKKFPEFNKAVNIYMYEKSKLLIKIQKKNVENKKIKWIKNFKKIKKGPVIFFGNEFFDAIPIKQFIRKGNLLVEKCYTINSLRLNETHRQALKSDMDDINSFKVLKNLKFVEYPKQGFRELDKIVKKISVLSGGILLIDYGYLELCNKSTLQTIMNNKKISIKSLLNNVGKADITSLVNFRLLNEYFLKKNLKVKKIVPQKFFLERMGIVERAKILEKKMTTKQKNYISITLNRLLNKNLMGNLFKVIFSFKSKNTSFIGFD